MKKLFIILAFCLCYLGSSNAQSVSESDLRKFSVTQETKVPFRLFPTSNDWNFLKLDTRTGQIWAVQFSIDKSSEKMTWTIDDTPIEEAIPENIGRFTLYPTSNMWNFILLDQFNGRTWQVQFYLNDRSSNFRSLIWLKN